MKETEKKRKSKEKTVLRMCHRCAKITESISEPQKCAHCNKAFLPLDYFTKIHDVSAKDYPKLFSDSENLAEEDLIKGLFVLW